MKLATFVSMTTKLKRACGCSADRAQLHSGAAKLFALLGASDREPLQVVRGQGREALLQGAANPGAVLGPQRTCPEPLLDFEDLL